MGDDTAIEHASRAPVGGIVRQESLAGSVQGPQYETAASAIAARVRAEVEAAYFIAQRMPRDLEQVRVQLLKECARPGFAKSARYFKPIGKDSVEGPSIRFAEAALMKLGNIHQDSIIVYDDEQKRIVRVTVVDLERNVAYNKDVTLRKVVERTGLRPGQVALSSRLNARGQITHLVSATEDDLQNKQQALESKALRTLALRILPGDIKDECMDACKETLRREVAQDPDAERRKMIDAFAELGIQPSDLKLYLGHDLDKTTPKEVIELRALFAALRDGEATWSEAIEHKTGGKRAANANPQTLDDLTTTLKRKTIETEKTDV